MQYNFQPDVENYTRFYNAAQRPRAIYSCQVSKHNNDQIRPRTSFIPNAPSKGLEYTSYHPNILEACRLNSHSIPSRPFVNITLLLLQCTSDQHHIPKMPWWLTPHKKLREGRITKVSSTSPKKAPSTPQSGKKPRVPEKDSTFHKSPTKKKKSLPRLNGPRVEVAPICEEHTG